MNNLSENKVPIIIFSEFLHLEPTFIHHLKTHTHEWLHDHPLDFNDDYEITFFMVIEFYFEIFNVLNWINENLNHLVWMRYSLGFGFRFLFYNEADAMYFKLTWADYIK